MNIANTIAEQGYEIYDEIRTVTGARLQNHIEDELTVYVFASSHPMLLLTTRVSLAVRDTFGIKTPMGINGPVFEQYWGSWGGTLSEDPRRTTRNLGRQM